LIWITRIFIHVCKEIKESEKKIDYEEEIRNFKN
jgi:hypothetical protein